MSDDLRRPAQSGVMSRTTGGQTDRDKYTDRYMSLRTFGSAPESFVGVFRPHDVQHESYNNYIISLLWKYAFGFTGLLKSTSH